jgi:hypothetical protein
VVPSHQSSYQLHAKLAASVQQQLLKC